MALQNIGAGNSDDAFYRYKMPKMITKIEGRGNGIKTNIVNMVDIAKALARPASYTTKYFGCELGAQSKFDEKTGVSLVNGAHDTAKLAGLLENFIKKYVQCYGCGNPETEVIVTKAQMITLKCAACGYVSDVDMRDKITTFIVKNPPEQKKGSKDKKALRRAEKERLKEGEAADEEHKKMKKEAVKKKSSAASKEGASKHLATKKKATSSDEEHSSPVGSLVGNNEASEDDDNDVQWQTDTSLEAARQRIHEQLSAVTAEMVMLSTNEEETQPQTDKAGDKNVKADKKHDEADEKHPGHSKGEIGFEVSSHQELRKDIQSHLKRGSTASQTRSFLTSLDAPDQDIMDALFEALFEGIDRGFAKVVPKKKNYLIALMKDSGSQVHLLHAIESFCSKSSPFLKEVALVVKVLYDDDLLEEQYIVRWYEAGAANKGAKNPQIWKNMKPFIEWLQNAESESEED